MPAAFFVRAPAERREHFLEKLAPDLIRDLPRLDPARVKKSCQL